MVNSTELAMSSRSFDNFFADSDELQDGFSTDFRSFGHNFSGDFYFEPESVKRGLTLPFDAVMGFSQTHTGWILNKSDCIGKSSSPRNQFESSDVPPALLEEMKANLELTTVHLKECSPITVGNKLLAILREEIDAQVKKVNWERFTIGADVVLEGLACAIKARIYQQDNSTILEFNRRSGDTVAFHKFYRKVSGHLQGHSCDHIAWDTASPQEVSHMTPLPPNEAIAPLLDMVAASQHVALLAEVALALSVVARDPTVAAQLRMPCALSALQQLQQVSDFSVAFPTSQMLACV